MNSNQEPDLVSHPFGLSGVKKTPPFKPGGGMPDNVNARAALISGPPGIGKTSACRLVAKLLQGYEVLEYNASDARGSHFLCLGIVSIVRHKYFNIEISMRNCLLAVVSMSPRTGGYAQFEIRRTNIFAGMKIINEMAAGIADNKTISFSGGLGARKVPGFTKRALIIMDEVDGMGAGDRGGNAALIRMIKKTKNPIICICNDGQSPKIRSLAFSCYHLKFVRPTKANVAQRCVQIAANEGLHVEQNALEELAESCGSDMRMVINQLQMLARSPQYRDKGVSYTDMKEKVGGLKEQALMLTSFDACKKLLNSSEGSRLSFRDRFDMFFVDHSIMGLLVQENYLKSVEKKPVSVELLNRCAFSADLMTLGDVINNKIRSGQNWSLLPDVALASAVYPAHVTNGFVAFPNFPAFLGKYSTQSKMSRLATELQTHLKLTAHVSRWNLASSGFAELLYKRCVRPLMQDEDADVMETVNLLDAYGLRKEHLMEHLTEMREHLGEEDLFKLVDPKVKAAMTREFNTGGRAVKVMLPSGGKKRRAPEENPDDVGDDAEVDKVTGEADKEGDDEGTGGFGGLIKIKKAPKAKAKAKGKAARTSASQAAPQAVLSKLRASLSTPTPTATQNRGQTDNL